MKYLKFLLNLSVWKIGVGKDELGSYFLILRPRLINPFWWGIILAVFFDEWIDCDFEFACHTVWKNLRSAEITLVDHTEVSFFKRYTREDLY